VLHPVFLYTVEKEYCCHIFLIGFYFFYLIGQNTRKDKVETCSGRCHCIRSSSDGRKKKRHFLVSTILSLLSWTNNCYSQTKGWVCPRCYLVANASSSLLCKYKLQLLLLQNSSFQDGINIKTTKIFHSVRVRLLIWLPFPLYSSVYLLLDVNITR
jgi:hypothetical protein